MGFPLNSALSNLITNVIQYVVTLVTGQYQEVPNLKTRFSVEGCGKSFRVAKLLRFSAPDSVEKSSTAEQLWSFLILAFDARNAPSPRHCFCVKIIVSQKAINP